jgi:Tol biopolymer transport system component
MRVLRLSVGLLLVGVSAAAAQMSMMTTGGGRPSVSPDGNFIAFSAARNGEWEIYVVRPDGSGRIQLTTTVRRTSSPSDRRLGSANVFRLAAGG